MSIEKLHVTFKSAKTSRDYPHWGVLTFVDGSGRDIVVKSSAWPWNVSIVRPGFSALLHVTPDPRSRKQYNLVDFEQTSQDMSITALTCDGMATLKQAQALVDKFGDDAVTAIQRVVQGVSNVSTLVIGRHITTQNALKIVRRASAVPLHEFELRIALVEANLQFLKSKDISVMCKVFQPSIDDTSEEDTSEEDTPDDPYVFIDEFKANPFRLFYGKNSLPADRIREIASHLCIPADNVNYINMEATILLKQTCADGHMYMTLNDLCRHFKFNHSVVKNALDAGDFKFQEHPTTREMCVYLPGVYWNEQRVLEKLRLLNKPSALNLIIPPCEFEKLDPWQAEALKGMCTHNLCAVSGSAGTGKTTLVRSFVKVLTFNKVEFVGLAFTGKAARNLQDRTGMTCTTIDSFTIDKVGVSSNSVVVVDEASMLHIPLAWKVLERVSANTPVIFVGDTNQLPPVMAGSGYGFFFSTLMRARCFPRYKLETPHRQAAGDGDGILHVANAILSPSLDWNDFLPRPGFKMIRIKPRKGKTAVGDIDIVGRVKAELETRGWDDSRVVCRTKAMAMKLNLTMQNMFNPGRGVVEMTGYGEKWEYRVGDPVMCLTNISNATRDRDDVETIVSRLGHSKTRCEGDTSKKSVFTNGMCGRVTGINDGVTLLFDDEHCEWPGDLLSRYIVPAYAMTIHKSQGSEYERGIVVIEDTRYRPFRSLMYTGVTRFKRECCVVSTKKSITETIASPQNKTFTEMMVELLDA